MNAETMWSHELHAMEEGYTPVCGVDEAGRGPLAGPVFAAAAILPFGEDFPGVDDSKKLSAARRDALFDQICARAVAFSIASASEREIDELNILNASMLAMRRAVAGLSVPPSFALIDGNLAREFTLPVRCIIGGDGKSVSIAAASILAKVARDRYMLEMSVKYPDYRFEQHKGYPTKLHYELLDAHGPCELHRRSFLKKHTLPNGKAFIESFSGIKP